MLKNNIKVKFHYEKNDFKKLVKEIVTQKLKTLDIKINDECSENCKSISDYNEDKR